MRRSFAVSVALLAIAFLLYRKSTRLWWTYDSPWLLHVAVGRRLTEAFTQPDKRHNLFVPLLETTNETLLALFGVEPARWYLVQVILIGLVAIALFAGLRLFVATPIAAGAAALFLLGPPVASTATILYAIHYFEAILFCAVAAVLFILGLRRGGMTGNIFSAVCYLAAVCAKEIAIPLPLALLVIPEGNIRTRAGRLAPHVIVFLIYAAWRMFVVGAPPASYGWALTPDDAPRIIASLPWRLIRAAAGASLPVGLTAIALAVACAAAAIRTWRAATLAAVALICAIAPIVPVSVEMQDRFALLPWALIVCAFAIGVSRLNHRKLIIVVAVVAIALVANRQEWAAEFTRSKRMSDEAHVWVHERGDVLLRNPAIPPGTMPELEWLKEEHFGHAKGARWFYDDIYLCTHPLEGRRILEFDPASRQVVMSRLDARRFCASIRNDVPMTAEFERRGDTLLWRFGPHERGTWRLVLMNGEHAWDVPRESAYRLGNVEQLSLRIGWRSPEGWVSYSPEIALDFTRQSRTTWRR